MRKFLQGMLSFFRSLVATSSPSGGTVGSVSATGTLSAKLIKGQNPPLGSGKVQVIRRDDAA